MKRDNIIATQGLTSLFDGQPDIDSTEKKVELIKTKLREFFNLKNVNFLFGAGTSSGAIDAMSNLSELIWNHCQNLRSLIETYQKNSYV